MPKKKKESQPDDNIEQLVDEAFTKKDEALFESMVATNDITDEAQRFISLDELWEAAAVDRSARLLILSISGTLALAVIEHGGKYLDHLLEEDANENKQG